MWYENGKLYYVKCFKGTEWIIIKFYKTPLYWKDMYVDSSWKGQYLLKKYLGNIYIQITSTNIGYVFQSVKEWLECSYFRPRAILVRDTSPSLSMK